MEDNRHQTEAKSAFVSGERTGESRQYGGTGREPFFFEGGGGGISISVGEQGDSYPNKQDLRFFFDNYNNFVQIKANFSHCHARLGGQPW